MAKSYFDLRKFHKFRRIVNAGSRGPFKPMFNRWGVRYLSWTRRMFVEKSRGGTADGVSWPKLKYVTYRRASGTNLRRTRGGTRHGRRSQSRIKTSRASGSVAILRDTGTLFKALTPGSPGNLFKYLWDGVRIGFGGPAKHPDGRATIRDIAVFHDTGKGNLPKRQILHRPNQDLVRKMMRDYSYYMNRIGKRL